MSAEEFAKLHNQKHHYYFEALILTNGTVEYAVPSHLYKMFDVCYGVPYEDMINRVSGKAIEVWDMIPHSADPVHWMVEDSGVISCWYNYIVVPYKCTKEQVETLKVLVKEGCISRDLDVVVSCEKSVISLLDNQYIDKVVELKDSAMLKAIDLKKVLVTV